MEGIFRHHGWESDMRFVKENNKENVTCAVTSSSKTCCWGTEQKIFKSGLEWTYASFSHFIFDILSLFFLFLSTTGAKHQQERDCVWLWWTKTQTTDQYVFWIKTQRIRFKVMEWRMEVGRALRVGRRKELWKIVARGQPTGWHLWSTRHCFYFLGSKVASSLSLFRVSLLKLDLANFNLEFGFVMHLLYKNAAFMPSSQYVDISEPLKITVNIQFLLCIPLWGITM